MQRDAILQRDYAYGLSHSQKVTNRQILSEGMEVAVWNCIHAVKDVRGHALWERFPKYKVLYLLECSAQSILNSSESTDAISRASMGRGTHIIRLLQAHIPGEPV